MLRVWLFDTMRLEVDGHGVPAPSARKVRLLLAILALERRPHPRESLAARLWPDVLDASARVSLRTALTQLRAALGTSADGCLEVSRDRVGLSGSDRVWTDMEDLDRRLAAGDVEAALAVEPGQLLSGLEDEWVYAQRDALLARVLSVMEVNAADAEARGELAVAVKLTRRQTALDPLAEEPQRDLIRRLAAAGDPSAAVAAYERFARHLRAELRMVPSVATRALVDAMRVADDDDAANEPPEPPLAAVTETRPSAARPYAAVRKTVTVLFAEVIEAEATGRQPDVEVRERAVASRLGELQAVLERHEGTVVTRVGDAVMTVFGVPVIHEDDPLRAIRAATELRRVQSADGHAVNPNPNIVLGVRVGIETGEVLAVTGEAVVSGEPATAARRLCDAAAVGEVLIGQRAHSRVAPLVAARPLEGGLTSDGRVPAALRLEEIRAEPSRGGRPGRSALVGRQRQLNALRALFANAVADRSCHLVSVLGAAGVGKSRLAAELIGELRGDAAVLAGRCPPYGDAITLWPLAEAVRGLIGRDEPSAARLTAEMAGDREAELIGQRLAVALGACDRGETSRAETSWAVRRLFEVIARRRPLVVIFDDLQWAQPAFLDLVEHVAELVRDAPLLLLCIARPELLDERPGWAGGKLNSSTLLLEPLDEPDSRQLIANLLERQVVELDVTARVAEAAEGNPLFVEEFLAMLMDSGLLTLTDGRWTASGSLKRLPIPPTIDALLTARLERLAPDERSVLQSAAIEGTHFHRASVGELWLGSGPAEIDATLTGLVRKDLIRPYRSGFLPGDAFCFRHGLIRDAAYRALPKTIRAELHERFGTWLQRIAGERLGEIEEVVGYHFARAAAIRDELGLETVGTRDLTARAVAHLEPAARRALARGDRVAAIALLERAGSLPGADERTRVGILTDLGAALYEAGRLSDADERLQQAHRMAARTGDECAAARVLLQQQFLSVEREPRTAAASAGTTLERVIPVLAAHGDDYGLCRAHRLRALLLWFSAQAAPAADAWDHAASHARRAGAEHERAEILVWIASSLVYGPTPVPDGLRRCEEIAREVIGNPVARASVLPKLAALHAMEGRFELARSQLTESRMALDELALGLNSAVSHHAVLVELLAGDPVAAEVALQRSFVTLKAMGDRALLATTAAYLAQTILAQGRDAEAAEFVDYSQELASADDVTTQAMWRGVRARLLAREGEIEAAERLGRAAVAILEHSDFVNQRAEALLDVAAVLELGGRPSAARLALRNGLRLFEQKGNRVSMSLVADRLAVRTPR